MDDLQSVALGEATADLAVRNGRVLFPGTGEFAERDVAVADGRVAAVGRDTTDRIDDDTRVIDAGGRPVVPGFIDAHAHMDYHVTLERAYHRVLGGGTTTIVNELMFIGAAMGADGVRQVLAASADLPLDVRVTVPPHELFDAFEPPHADAAETDALLSLVEHDRSLGAGETVWRYVVGEDPPARALLDAAHDAGGVVVGHGAGCRGRNLDAFAAMVDNDHEAITAEQVEERFENGIHVVGRYGSTRDDVGAVAEAYEGLGPDGFSLGTDGMEPRKLVAEGYMDAVVRRTVEEGVDPADAIRMATLNTADHFGMGRKGRIAPGKDADIVILDDLETVAVDTVIAGGEVVVEDGEPVVAPRAHSYPDRFYDSLHLDPGSEPFRVPASRAVDGEVRAIAYRGELVTEETTVEPRVEDGELRADPENDVVKAAVFDRHPAGTGRGFTGFLTGFGLETGAVATSLAVERTGVVAIGAADAAMRVAFDRVGEMGGGWAVAEDEEVVADLPMPVAGTCADEPVEEVAPAYERVADAIAGVGVDVDRPLFGLQCLTHPGVPYIRLSFAGYADTHERAIVGLSP